MALKIYIVVFALVSSSQRTWWKHAFESPSELVFRLIDVDGSGTITFEELKDACKGMDYDDDKLEELMKQSDADNDGIITLDEMKVFPFVRFN